MCGGIILSCVSGCGDVDAWVGDGETTVVLGGGGNNYISCCLAVVLYTPGWREHCGFRS